MLINLLYKHRRRLSDTRRNCNYNKNRRNEKVHCKWSGKDPGFFPSSVFPSSHIKIRTRFIFDRIFVALQRK